MRQKGRRTSREGRMKKSSDNIRKRIMLKTENSFRRVGYTAEWTLGTNSLRK